MATASTPVSFYPPRLRNLEHLKAPNWSYNLQTMRNSKLMFDKYSPSYSPGGYGNGSEAYLRFRQRTYSSLFDVFYSKTPDYYSPYKSQNPRKAREALDIMRSNLRYFVTLAKVKYREAGIACRSRWEYHILVEYKKKYFIEMME